MTRQGGTKEVWIGLGGTQSAGVRHGSIHARVPRLHDGETEKMEVRELAEKLGGDMEAAIRQIAEGGKKKNSKQIIQRH